MPFAFEETIGQQIALLTDLNAEIVGQIESGERKLSVKDLCDLGKAVRENAATIRDLADRIEDRAETSEEAEALRLPMLAALRAIHRYVTSYPAEDGWYMSAMLLQAVRAVPGFAELNAVGLSILIFKKLAIADSPKADKCKRFIPGAHSRTWHYRLDPDRMEAAAARMGFALTESCGEGSA